MLRRDRRPQDGLEDVGLSHEAKVAGMRGVGGPLGVVAVEVIALDVKKLLHAILDELLVGRFQCRVGGIVVLVAVGQDPRIRVAAVLHPHDRRRQSIT